MPFDEPIHEIDGAQSRQRRSPRSDDTQGGARQMRRRREAKYVGDVAQVVAGILGQLGGGDDAHEIDDSLEVRPAAGGERSLRCSRVT